MGVFFVGFFLFWVFLIMFIIFFVILYWKLLVLSKKEEKYLNLDNSITKYKEKHGIEVIILNDI